MTISPGSALAAIGVPGSKLAILCGLLFIARCEFGNFQEGKPENWFICWSGGAAIAGVTKGVELAKEVGKEKGFSEGFNTYNPSLKRPKDEEEGAEAPDRHSSRATGRQV